MQSEKNIYLRSVRLICISLLLAAISCTSTKVTTFERVVGGRVDEAYISPGADFSRYTRIYAMPLEIYYEQGAGEPSAEDLQRMRDIFRTAFLAEIGDAYSIVREPAKDALGVRASLIDFKTGAVGNELPVHGRLRALVESGELTFLMELSDSVSGEVLARAADKEKPTDDADIAADSSSAEWDATRQAAERWAKIFHDFLDANLASGK
jgi:hypothetical protein